MRRSFWIMLVGPRGQHKNSYKTGCTWKRGKYCLEPWLHKQRMLQPPEAGRGKEEILP
jgi:hypothetical protein